MLDAAREAVFFGDVADPEALGGNRMRLLSIIKDIEIIGEAASRVSNETVHSHPQVPWGDAVAMRNRLVHGYFDVDAEVVWNTVKKDLPPLIAVLAELLAHK